MSLKQILCLTLTLFIIGCSDYPTQTNPPKSYKKYNILWLVTEDMSAYIPPFGDSTVLTPNLSRLANEGVRYTNLHSPSGVCSPSRYAIATGRYPTSDGAHNMRVGGSKEMLESIGLKAYEVVPPKEVKLLGELLRAQGYYTSNNAKTDYQLTETITTWDDNSQSAHWRNREEGQPFFSIFNFVITHESQFFGLPSPMSWRYFDNFPQEGTNYPWGGSIDSSQWQLNKTVYPPPVPPYLPDTEAVQKDLATMYSNIVYMDQQVGIILDQLEADGLLDQTIIAWYSDHGGPLPRQKRLIYDAGLKAPMIVRYPDQKNAGTVDDQLISFVDLAPTFLSLVDLPPAAFHEGVALAGKYKSPENRKYIYAAVDRLDEFYDRQRAVKDERYKYIRNFNPELPYYQAIAYREQIGSMQELLRLRDAGQLNDVQMQWFRDTKDEEELFDTWNDPHELNNIADLPEMQDKLKELRQACEQWMVETDDKGALIESEMAQQFWPDWQQPQTPAPTVSASNRKIAIEAQDSNYSLGFQILEEDDSLRSNWSVYTEPLTLAENQKLAVVADRLGWQPSDVVYFENQP